MNETTKLTQELKSAAKEAGADLIGIASIDRFDGVAPEHHPCSIYPETQSVIVIAKRIVRGALRGVEEGTQMLLYAQFARTWLPDRFLAMITVSTATFLEDNRYEAVPLPNLPTQTPVMGIAVEPGKPAPNVMVDFNHAAVRAGLGEIGYHGELMTPEFGPLQKIQMILTDAKLSPDPICTTPVCDYCGECVKMCPVNAMSAVGETTLELCGKTMRIANIDFAACNACRNGASPNDKHSAGRPERIPALCVRTCVEHLQKENRLTKQFQNSFRHRPAWQIDAVGKASLVEEV